MSESVLKVGDLMRFSVELIRDIAAMPDRSTQLVEVIRIHDDGDTKTVWVKNVLPAVHEAGGE